MGQTNVPETLVIHQKLRPGYNPKTFKLHFLLCSIMFYSIPFHEVTVSLFRMLASFPCLNFAQFPSLDFFHLHFAYIRIFLRFSVMYSKNADYLLIHCFVLYVNNFFLREIRPFLSVTCTNSHLESKTSYLRRTVMWRCTCTSGHFIVPPVKHVMNFPFWFIVS
jgi:hypothetical protein